MAPVNATSAILVDVTFDLFVWPVDRALSADEAMAMANALNTTLPFGIGHDKRLDPFIAEIKGRYPGIGGPNGPPCEFDVHRDHIFLGISWSGVESMVPVVADIAWRTGLAVYDPQQGLVGLPAPFGDAPMTSEGVGGHVRTAESAFAAIERGAVTAPGEGDAVVRRSIDDELRAAGFRQFSPLGFEITPDVAEEVLADPLRMPPSMQTSDRKADLIADLASTAVGKRHAAIVQLAAWDEDPDVAAALRTMLGSEDVFEASQAASGLARQGDVTDFPALVDLVHRMSPADGGTLESMLAVLPAALDLAVIAGPIAIDGLRSRALLWREPLPANPRDWQVAQIALMDELLASR